LAVAELFFLGTNARTAQGYHGNFYFDEFFSTYGFNELNKVASGMAMQKKYRKTYFSTPSSMGHEAYPFWTGERRNRGRPASERIKIDVGRKRLSGTYNARRDNLERYWRRHFGYTHGLMVIDTFWENVQMSDGRNQELQFTLRSGEPMLVACLWANWTDPAGVEPDLPCFAAITDEPEPEVAAAGHDRTIINIKPEHIDAWLNPEPGNLAALYAIFDDKRHPFYEHRLAA
jgi:putative SOS response-associated peptidase YedK